MFVKRIHMLHILRGNTSDNETSRRSWKDEKNIIWVLHESEGVLVYFFSSSNFLTWIRYGEY